MKIKMKKSISTYLMAIMIMIAPISVFAKPATYKMNVSNDKIEVLIGNVKVKKDKKQHREIKYIPYRKHLKYDKHWKHQKHKKYGKHKKHGKHK